MKSNIQLMIHNHNSICITTMQDIINSFVYIGICICLMSQKHMKECVINVTIVFRLSYHNFIFTFI